MSRPQVSARPSTPNVSSRPNIPSNVNRPNIGAGGGGAIANRPATRPSLPGTGSGVNRPSIGDGAANRPATRPGTGNRPSTLPGLGGGDRPGVGDRPNAGNRPATQPGNRWQNLQNNRGDFISNRHDQINDRLNNRDDRQSNRDDRQSNRQDYRNDRREDWQNHWDDRYGHHGDWYHGWCDNGHWNNWWDHMWNEHPVWGAFAITNWSLNTASWLFGLGSYSNPYYYADSGSSGGYDYSQPLIMEQPSATAAPAPAEASAGTALPPGVTQQGLALYDEARDLFHNKQYKEALAKCNEALKQMPQDATLHEFKALCQFVEGDYKNAAATLYAVLSVGPGWDWTTMANLFESVDEYTSYLRKLEDYCRENKESAPAYFVLGYHYLTMDKKDLALRMYKIVAKLAPNDTVTKQLLQGLGYEPPANQEAPPAAKEPEKSPAIPPEKLVGEWKASGPNNTSFTLKLAKEGGFTWSYTKNGKTESVKGAYGQQGVNLVMETDGDNTMISDIKLVDDSTLEFQMTGVPDSPKLIFKK